MIRTQSATDIHTRTHAHTRTLACTEMTKTKKIEILRAVYVVELSWASMVIIFSFKSLCLGCRALQ